MSRKTRTFRLRLLEGQIGEVAYQITKVHFSNFHDSGVQWRPPINVFQCASCFRICIELAGVDSDQIEVEVEMGRIWIRGYREAPEPLQQQEFAFSTTRKPVRVITMEIDHGRFERDVEIPPGYDQEESPPSGKTAFCGYSCHESLTPDSRASSSPTRSQQYFNDPLLLTPHELRATRARKSIRSRLDQSDRRITPASVFNRKRTERPMPDRR